MTENLRGVLPWKRTSADTDWQRLCLSCSSPLDDGVEECSSCGASCIDLESFVEDSLEMDKREARRHHRG
jgi:hypothetical protein